MAPLGELLGLDDKKKSNGRADACKHSEQCRLRSCEQGGA